MKSSTLRRLTTHLVVIAALGLVACTSVSSSSSDQPKSGVRAVDQAIEAVLERDAAGLAAQVAFTAEPCSTADGFGGRPRCRAGEANGTVVEALFVASCEGFHLRRNEIAASLQMFLEGNPEFYAAYRHSGEIFPIGTYVAVFDSPFNPPFGMGASQIFMEDEGIVGINFGCGQPARDLVEFQSLGEPLIAPKA
jgi:hypothetical protein